MCVNEPGFPEDVGVIEVFCTVCSIVLQIRHVSARILFQGGIQCLLVDKEILFSASWDMTVMVRLHMYRFSGGGGTKSPPFLIRLFCNCVIILILHCLCNVVVIYILILFNLI